VTLPPGLSQAFRMAAAELGMCSAAQLFVRELAAEGRDEIVKQARDTIGREYPVFDFVAASHLEGEAETSIDPGPVLDALGGITRLLMVGLEAFFLDALVARLDANVDVGLVAEGAGLEPEMRRVLANYNGRVTAVGLGDIHRWAGRKSALCTFVYGTDGHVVHVNAAWLRVSGPDVRTLFRSLIGWDILGKPMLVYPRWLVETSRAEFSHLVGKVPKERASHITPLALGDRAARSPKAFSSS